MYSLHKAGPSCIALKELKWAIIVQIFSTFLTTMFKTHSVFSATVGLLGLWKMSSTEDHVWRQTSKKVIYSPFACLFNQQAAHSRPPGSDTAVPVLSRLGSSLHELL